MARRTGKPVAAGTVPPATPTTPPPPADLDVTLTTVAKGTVLHRVHLDQYGGTTFNPGKSGNARFSPIRNDEGAAIPTLYAGSSLPCALMESVFHDVSYAPGFKAFDEAKLKGQVHSRIDLTRDVTLADFRNVALRKAGITRNQLIDTEKDQYPHTRAWAEAVHRHAPAAQGLLWISRQDDTGQAIMLFGDRIADGTLRQNGSSCSLVGDDRTYEEVLDLADRIGVTIVPGIG